MQVQVGKFVAAHAVPPPHPAGDVALSNALLRQGTLRLADLRLAQTEARRDRLALVEVLQASGAVAPDDLARAMAEASGLPVTDLRDAAPDPRLIDRLGAQRCLALGVLPLRRAGGTVHLVLERPDTWPRIADEIQAVLGPVTLSHAPPEAIRTAIAAVRGQHLRLLAEARLSPDLSVRSLRTGGAGPLLGGVALLCLAIWPLTLLAAVLIWLMVSLGATTALRATALGLAWRNRTRPPPAEGALPLRLPVVSVLVPLYGEPDIAPRLLQRLGRLDYPRALLDVVIVLEAKDAATRAALAGCRLPGWMRVVTVPDGPITTKPRAMNLALDHCRGSIIGIYDAEDAPDPDQIRKVVQRFANRGPEVACLQGALDYYNPRTNLIARLFTAEYAAWFRVMMPALEHLRLPMPLGGTTLFLRRTALERIGAWDSHNVTEDADLGVRLARHGLRTEMLPTTTHEEANCRLRPWVKQRSRWIKGHILTWAVHMRNPVALWRDLGPRGFFGYQLVFLGAQSQVLLAPVMWSFWLILAGLPHPVQALLPSGAIAGLIVLFMLAEALVMATAAVGLSRTRHHGLAWWVPFLHVYHPLGAIAGWRALWEAFSNPFYWAKTSHGHFDLQEIDQAARPPAPGLRALAPSPGATAAAAPEPAASRVARTLAQTVPLAPIAGERMPAHRVRTSPASIFRRVSKAREIWVRSVS